MSREIYEVRKIKHGTEVIGDYAANSPSEAIEDAHRAGSLSLDPKTFTKVMAINSEGLFFVFEVGQAE